MKNNLKRSKKWGILVLFSSFSTLLCCALPILLVSLGMGAVVASLVSNLPWLITLSQYKAWVFGVTALILIGSYWCLYRPAKTCPIELEAAKLCHQTHKWNCRFYWVSIIIWCIGAFTAFVFPVIQNYYD